MVASDTLVGLVGAGILLVALAGVFVFESRDTGVDKDLEATSYDVNANPGTLTYTAATGVTNPVTNQCAVPGQCTPQQVSIQLTLASAPSLPSTSGLRYVAMLTGGTTNLVLGTLTADGANYEIETQKAAQPGSNRLVVSLERTDNPSRPSEIVLYNKTISQPMGAGAVDVKGTATVNWAGGSGSASLQETDQGLQVDITTTGSRNWSAAGYVYRAWLHNAADQTVGYTFLGNLTNGNLSVGVAGAQLDSYNHVFVTLEPSNTAPPRTASAAGGPIVYRMQIGAEPTPTIAR